MIRLPRAAFVAFLLLTLAASVPAAERCSEVSMTVTASSPNDPGFEGLYKYTLFGTWEVWPRALSHVDIFLMLQECPFICTPGVVGFEDTVGVSTGAFADDSPCFPVYYLGEYLCNGDPSLPDDLQTSVVKFEPFDGQPCEPSTVGMGTWSFYSPLVPGPSTIHSDVVVIKHGQYVCTGDVSGQLPICSIGVQPERWGRLKTLYR